MADRILRNVPADGAGAAPADFRYNWATVDLRGTPGPDGTPGLQRLQSFASGDRLLIADVSATAGDEQPIATFYAELGDLASFFGGGGGNGGASSFVELTDTPANYSSSANRPLRVNAGGTAVEFGAVGQFVPAGGAPGQLLSKIDGSDHNTEWVEPPEGTATATRGWWAIDGTTLTAPNGTTSTLDVADTYTLTAGNSGRGLHYVAADEGVTSGTLIVPELTQGVRVLVAPGHGHTGVDLVPGAGVVLLVGDGTERVGDGSATEARVEPGTVGVLEAIADDVWLVRWLLPADAEAAREVLGIGALGTKDTAGANDIRIATEVKTDTSGTPTINPVADNARRYRYTGTLTGNLTVTLSDSGQETGPPVEILREGSNEGFVFAVAGVEGGPYTADSGVALKVYWDGAAYRRVNYGAEVGGGGGTDISPINDATDYSVAPFVVTGTKAQIRRFTAAADNLIEFPDDLAVGSYGMFVKGATGLMELRPADDATEVTLNGGTGPIELVDQVFWWVQAPNEVLVQGATDEPTVIDDPADYSVTPFEVGSTRGQMRRFTAAEDNLIDFPDGLAVGSHGHLIKGAAGTMLLRRAGDATEVTLNGGTDPIELTGTVFWWVAAPDEVLLEGETGEATQLYADLDANGNVISGNLAGIATVSGTLTAAHSGQGLVTSGHVTIPQTVGFNCTLLAGGAHTVTFNSLTSAAMAAGDLMTILVQTTTVAHIRKSPASAQEPMS